MSKKYLAKGTLWIMLGMFFQQFMGYVNTALVLRFVDVSTYGTLIFLTSLFGIIGIFSKQGMQVAAIKFTAEYIGKNQADTARKIFNTAKWFNIFAAFLLIMISPIIYHYLPEKITNHIAFEIFILFYSTIAFAGSLLALNNEGLIGLKKIFLGSLTRSILQPLIRSIVILSVLYFLPNITGLIYTQIIPILCVYFMSEFLMHKLNFSFSRPTFSYTKKLYQFSLPLMGTDLLTLGIYQIDRIFLGFMSTPESVGIYNVANRIAFLVIAPYWASAKVFSPMVSEYWSRKEYGKLRSYYQKITYYYMFILSSFLSLIIANDYLILGFFGEKFVTDDSRLVLIIIGIGLLFQTIPGQNGMLYRMTGKTYLSTLSTFLTTMINIFLNYFLIMKYGLLGAGIATSASIILVNLIGLFYFKYVYQNLVHPFCKKYFVNVIYMIVIVGVAILTEKFDSLLRNVIVFAIIIVCFFILYYKEFFELYPKYIHKSYEH